MKAKESVEKEAQTENKRFKQPLGWTTTTAATLHLC